MLKLFSVLPALIIRGFLDGVRAGRNRRYYGRRERIHRVSDTKEQRSGYPIQRTGYLTSDEETNFHME